MARVFRVRGGTRVPAGPASGQVRVTAAAAIDDTRVRLRVEPVGDYSTYTLELVWDASRIDPFFSSLGFKFRPGCFTNDCAPRVGGRPSVAAPGQATKASPAALRRLSHCSAPVTRSRNQSATAWG